MMDTLGLGIFDLPSPDKQIERKIVNPTRENANRLFESIRDFHDWGVSDLDAYTWFMTDVEWSWMNGATPIEDW